MILSPRQRLQMWIALVALAFGCAPPQPTQAPPPQSTRTTPAALQEPSIEDEVVGNILQQSIGRHRVADLHLPEQLLRRMADRIIRSSFEERYRIVVRDPAARTLDGDQPAKSPPASPQNLAADGAIIVYESPLPDATLARWRRWANAPEQRPSNRGFMPALTASDFPDWPLDEPPDGAEERVLAAAEIVAQRLARDGLLTTTVEVIRALGPPSLLHVDESALVTLRQTGLPVDLLRHFSLPDGAAGVHIIEHFAQSLDRSVTPEMLRKDINRARFHFQPTQPGFALATESGEHEPAFVLAQVTRGGYWKGPGDGGNADLLRQTVAALPDTRFVVSVERHFASDFTRTANTWRPNVQEQGAAARVTVVPQELSIAQWAQDNSKSGWIDVRGTRSLAMIVPRYASRNEDGSVFAPGESLLAITAAEALTVALVHSPLLFQGGSLLAVRNPRSGERLLFIGEAEIARNTAFGLTPEQALEALRVEFGVDRAITLPAVSFHLDYDLSIRAAPPPVTELIALVNDPWPAARLIVREATNALHRAKVIDAAIAAQVFAAIELEDDRALLDALAPAIYATSSDALGGFPLSLAEHLSTSSVDSGVGNLQRLLLAMDLFASRTLREDELPADRHTRSYLQSLQRLERDRLALHEHLQGLGLRVSPVPSISAERRSVTAVNGIHLASTDHGTGRYLMPATGGLYAALDQAAADAIRQALGSIEVIPITCGESQRRCGALHCSVSVYPRLADDKAPAASQPEDR